mmetsp:Transcript_43099/g.88106  ORF Transcript_43099/g.88106 Transcript_43099/m.88106 type:complete len:201 (-) Transcript_43099:443-1045(-)
MLQGRSTKTSRCNCCDSCCGGFQVRKQKRRCSLHKDHALGLWAVLKAWLPVWQTCPPRHQAPNPPPGRQALPRTRLLGPTWMAWRSLPWHSSGSMASRAPTASHGTSRRQSFEVLPDGVGPLDHVLRPDQDPRRCWPWLPWIQHLSCRPLQQTSVKCRKLHRARRMLRKSSPRGDAWWRWNNLTRTGPTSPLGPWRKMLR